MLKQWGFPNLSAVSVWSNGCRGLSRLNSASAPDDLLQLATKISGNKILFYAEANNTWRYNEQKKFFEHEQSEYSDAAYIYITDSKPVRDIRIAAQAATATDVTHTYTYDYRDYHERIDTNLLRSGRRFFGEVYDAVRQHSINFNIPALDVSSPELKMQVCAAARSTNSSDYSISVNNGSPYSLLITPVIQNVDYMKADTALFENIPVSSENINLKITYNRPANSPSAWGVWDFTTINARASLRLQNSQLLFRDTKTVGAGRATQFHIASSQQNVKVWDVTNLHDVQEIGGVAASGNISFTVETPTLREFVAFADNMLLNPEYVSDAPNQNLHGASPSELVIVTHPALAAQAGRLADFHRSKDNMSTLVVTTEEVYNEFSGGLPDVSAIRNFMRMFHRRNADAAPKYLLLFGGGAYVNHEGKKGVGLIPTFQSENSLVSEQSYVSDDFFVLLDDNEYFSDAGMVGSLDMAVGRIPARNEAEATTLVDKIEQYSANLSGDWMSKCIIIADDEDNNDHVQQAEKIGSYIMDSAPSYYVNKIYMDAYVQQSTPMGKRYPDVTDAINSAIGSGALLVNYTGHANDQWLSHEQVVTISDIKRWNNRSRLPLFITATCEFSRFDHPNGRSAGEQVLFLPNGGGIAMLSTTRLVYSGANSALNQRFIEEFFRKDSSSGHHARIGEMVRRTKNASTTGINQLNFSLLGDPALMLHFPSFTAQTTRINGIPYATPDTLKALSKDSIEGRVSGSDLNDIIHVSVFDKEQVKQTRGNSGQTPFSYRTQSNLLYRGKVSTPAGSFTAKFVVPQDIIPSYGIGKITYVGKAGDALVAGCDYVPVGGISDNAIADSTPPSIRMYMNDERWTPGGTTTEAPTFIALLADSSGINITGYGVGRDITLTLQPANKTYILNSYYTAGVDSYTSGRVEFPIPPLEKGQYTATLKVWDVVNNPAEQSVEFRVADDERFTLSKVLNYPNPFTQKTAFFFEHNRPYTDMEVLIQVFTISGKLVKTIRCGVPQSSASLRSAPIEWDGRDDYGAKLGRGTYLYKIKARCNNSGEHAEKVEKLVLLN
jgi:hypothetical protein